MLRLLIFSPSAFPELQGGKIQFLGDFLSSTATLKKKIKILDLDLCFWKISAGGL